MRPHGVSRLRLDRVLFRFASPSRPRRLVGWGRHGRTDAGPFGASALADAALVGRGGV